MIVNANSVHIPFTFGSLFAGIGGFDLGLERAGMQCMWQVENDPFCISILEKHCAHVRRYKDVTTTTNLPAVDLICGGFPCQPHSVAGQRKGANDSRDLWKQFLRIIQECRPNWVLGENVPGIDTTILASVCSDLAHEGYSVTVFGITACSVGAPHRRERRFIVGYSQHDGFTSPDGEREKTKPSEQERTEGQWKSEGTGSIQDAANPDTIG